MGTFAVSEEKKLPSIVPDVVRDVVCALAFMVSFFIFNPHNGTFYALAKAVAILITAWFIWRMIVQAYKRKYYLSYGRWAQTLIAPIIYSMVVASGLQYFSVMDEQVPAQPGIAGLGELSPACGGEGDVQLCGLPCLEAALALVLQAA